MFSSKTKFYIGIQENILKNFGITIIFIIYGQFQKMYDNSMEKISIKDELPITCKPVMLSGNPEVGKRFSYPLWRINRETLVFFSLLLIPSSIHTIYDTCVGKRVCVSVIHQYHEPIPHTQPQKPSLLCERE